jgi:dienelactone hydrolase
MKSVKVILPGTFGDKEVRLRRCIPAEPNGVDVVLLHGLHSSANLMPKNKFRFMAKLLTERGFTAWLVETSRSARNRYAFKDDVAAWVKAAFTGKTFANERDDFFTAIEHVTKAAHGKALWLWGFSLGGVMALLASAAMKISVERLMMSGTGMLSFADIDDELKPLPVVSTLQRDLAPEMTHSVRTGAVVAFRGTEDGIFSSESCLDLLAALTRVPEKLKLFREIAGADHSFRLRYGSPDPTVMREMVDFAVNAFRETRPAS